jgi:hypothetical protein
MSRFAMRADAGARERAGGVGARESARERARAVVAWIRPIERARGARGGVARAIASGWVCVVMSGVSRVVVVVVVVFVLTVLCVYV